MSEPPSKTPRYVVFAAIVTVVVLASLNWGVGLLEDWGLIDTHNPDDAVQYVDDALFERDGDLMRTTPYALESVLPGSFRRKKGDALRLFVTGASFSMGTPYQDQGSPMVIGGIAAFLRAELAQRLPDRPIEVLNLGSGGADSGRVAEVALQALEHEPDAIFVATCNNDGTVHPADWRRQLHAQPGYRLLRQLLRDRSTIERSWFAPNDQPSDVGRQQLRKNLMRIVEAAAEAEVPVLLATLPVNLRYPGFDPLSRDVPKESAAALFEAPQRGTGALDPALEAVDPCEAGIWLAQAGETQAAISTLRRCAMNPEAEGQLPPFAPSYLGLAELENGRVDPWAEDVLRDTWGECLATGMIRYAAGEYDAAFDGLLDCEELAEGLQWAGLSRWKQGRHDEAKAILKQAAELDPRNRCRPSMNEVIREVAAAHEHVHLVDFEALAEAADPTGVPGPGMFLDSCHMNWRGYAAMTGGVLDTMEGVLSIPAAEPDFEALAAELGLPPGGNAAQIAFFLDPPREMTDPGGPPNPGPPNAPPIGTPGGEPPAGHR